MKVVAAAVVVPAVHELPAGFNSHAYYWLGVVDSDVSILRFIVTWVAPLTT